MQSQQTYSPDEMAQLLSALFQNDTSTVKQATQILKKYFKKSQALENLLILMATHQEQNIRQISCVYMRKIICNLWCNLPIPDQEKTKQLLLQRYVEEPVTIVKKNIADVIGSLGKLLIPNKEWNELFQFVFQYTQSNDLVHKELAMMLLSVIIEYFSINEINTYYPTLNTIIVNYLQSDVPSLKRLSVETVNNLSQSQDGIKVLKKYPELIPLVLSAIDLNQEDLIQKIFETLTDFLDYKKLITPYLPILIDAAVNISLNADISFNVKEVTIHFLEEIGHDFCSYFVKKKQIETIKKIVNCGFKLACESTEDYEDEAESPHSLSLFLLYNFASGVTVDIIYPIFKDCILQLCKHEDPNYRKAGLKVMGHVCDSDGLLDPMKDDIDLLTALVVRGMQDSTLMVRQAAALVVGQFSENIVPDFLELHGQVFPCLLQMLDQTVDLAVTKSEYCQTAEKSLYAMAEFAANMDDIEIKPYLAQCLNVILKYLNGKGQRRSVRYQSLNALSAVILAAQHLILPNMIGLLENLYEIVRTSTDKDSQQVKGQALMCAGNLANACGKEKFPQQALEEFTKFALECLTRQDSKLELREQSFAYFAEIAKILKSQMAPVFDIIFPEILKSISSEDGIHTQTAQNEKEFDLDSDKEDGEEVVGLNIDTDFIDEKSSAIHALGQIALNCPSLTIKHIEKMVNELVEVAHYVHENVRYQVCLTLTQIAFGLLHLFTGQGDEEFKYKWEPGLILKEPFPQQVTEFLSKVVYPHFQKLINDEENKEVIEKVLECIRDVADEMGPGGVVSNLPWIIGAVDLLLEKEAKCQQRDIHDLDSQDEDEQQSEDDEDYDHDEIILGNTTDVIMSIAKCLGNDFAPYLQQLGPKLVQYLGPEHPKSDKEMIIGCLSEVLNSCPVAIQYYFDDFFQVILQHSTTNDGGMNRNCSYALGILAEKAPEKFKSHVKTACMAVNMMHEASDSEDAKDNCIACLCRIVEKFSDQFSQQEYDLAFDKIMSALPLDHDPAENETVLKFAMNSLSRSADRVNKWMDKLSLTCLKILTDTRVIKDISDQFKVLTAKFIKNVILPSDQQKLAVYESQMSEYERNQVMKYMNQA